MIYVFEEGDYEDRHVAAVFEGPAGRELGLAAFLTSLGLRPAPRFPDPPASEAAEDVGRFSVAVFAYNVDRRAWDDERIALLKGKAIYKQEEQAHLRWLRQHPDLTAIEFELI